ncbi:MAG TPA: hypothetical protein VIH89_08195 [Candidatus Sulfotelmatobacter sp.]
MIKRSVAASCLLLASVSLAFGQDASATSPKTVQVEPYVPKDLIKIVKIKLGSVEVKLGMPFLSKDEWFSQLAVVVKNVSTKKIIFASGQLRFPETGDASPEHLMVMERILIGQRPDSAHDPSISGLRPDDVPSAPILVNHGQEMIIPVVDRFDRIKRLIEQRQALSSVTTCVAGINTLYFDDGTSWMAPGYTFVPTRLHRESMFA